MIGWMDKWMDVQMDGWMDRRRIDEKFFSILTKDHDNTCD